MAITARDLDLIQQNDNFASRELTELTEGSDAWWLGTFAVSKQKNWYKWGWAGVPSATTRLMIREQPLVSGGRVWAVVFRQFDRFGGTDDPPEIWIGWIADANRQQGLQWLAFMNDQLRQRRTAASAVRTLVAAGHGSALLIRRWDEATSEDRAAIEGDAAASLLDDALAVRAAALALFVQRPAAADRHALSFAATAYSHHYLDHFDPQADTPLVALLGRALAARQSPPPSSQLLEELADPTAEVRHRAYRELLATWEVTPACGSS